MRKIFLTILFFAWVITKGQSLVGKYDTRNESHTNHKHYEELILKADSSFDYLTRMEFIQIKKTGKWSIASDTLILSEENPCCKTKIVVEERCNKRLPKGKVRFFVTSIEGEDINYHVVVTNRDSTQTIYSRTGITELKIKRLKQFYFIVNSLVYSPVYNVKALKSNEFKVKLSPNRFFCNEKWLIRNNLIVPMGWNNQYVNYHLKQQGEKH